MLPTADPSLWAETRYLPSPTKLSSSQETEDASAQQRQAGWLGNATSRWNRRSAHAGEAKYEGYRRSDDGPARRASIAFTTWRALTKRVHLSADAAQRSQGQRFIRSCSVEDVKAPARSGREGSKT